MEFIESNINGIGDDNNKLNNLFSYLHRRFVNLSLVG